MAETFRDATGLQRGPDYRQAAIEAANRHGVDPQLFLKLVQQESGFDPNAVSSAGAQGLTQLMPGTAEYLGVTDPFDPYQNLDGGARFLRQQLDDFGDPSLALAAYNAGPGNVRKYGGIPPFKETQNYVRNILGGGTEGYDQSLAMMGQVPLSFGLPEETEEGERSSLERIGSAMTAFEALQNGSEYCPAGYIYNAATDSCVPLDSLATSLRPQRRPARGAALERFGIPSLIDGGVE